VRGRGARGRQAHHQLGGRRRLGAAVALLRRQHARLRRRLRELAPLALGRADRLAAGQGRRRHAARRLVQLDALGRRARRAGGGRALRRRARAVAARLEEDQHPRGAGALRIVARFRACSAPTSTPTSGGALYRKSSFLEGCLGQRVLAEHPRPARGPARRARQRGRRRSTTRAW
jgi:hypothetical protein